MGKTKKKEQRDELFWLFPVLLVVAIIAITVFVKPGSFQETGDTQVNPSDQYEGQASGVQGESVVIVPDRDDTGVRTAEDLTETLESGGYLEEVDVETEMTGMYIDRTEPGPGLDIVITSDIMEEGNKDIYLIDETGYNPTRLTDWPSVESFPAITSDGKRVYFVSDRDDDPNNPNPYTKNTEIYMIDMELFGTPSYEGPTRLTYNNETDYGVSVSADGSRMVYVSQTKTNPDNPFLILADGDANNGQVIADTLLKNCVPKISGDGNYIVYNSMFDGEMDIYLYDVSEGVTVNLTNSDIPEYFPAINYDGSVIVYEKLLGITPQNEDLIELYTIDRDGVNEQQITFNRFADTFPAITDDGQYLVFVSKRWDFDGDDHFDEALFYMEMGGEEVYKITKDPFYEEQPDV